MQSTSMGRIAKLALAAACAALSACASHPPAPATARVTVEFVQPERFTDFGPRYATDALRDAYTDALRQHLVQRAAPLLPVGQTLSVAITDVDMAGRTEPWHQDFHGRVVRNVYPTRIDLRFQVTARDGSVLRGGQRTLQDSYFLARPLHDRNDPLRYEKALLDHWLEHELACRSGGCTAS
jgi:hypothetical protein